MIAFRACLSRVFILINNYAGYIASWKRVVSKLTILLHISSLTFHELFASF